VSAIFLSGGEKKKTALFFSAIGDKTRKKRGGGGASCRPPLQEEENAKRVRRRKKGKRENHISSKHREGEEREKGSDLSTVSRRPWPPIWKSSKKKGGGRGKRPHEFPDYRKRGGRTGVVQSEGSGTKKREVSDLRKRRGGGGRMKEALSRPRQVWEKREKKRCHSTLSTTRRGLFKPEGGKLE